MASREILYEPANMVFFVLGTVASSIQCLEIEGIAHFGVSSLFIKIDKFLAILSVGPPGICRYRFGIDLTLAVPRGALNG